MLFSSSGSKKVDGRTTTEATETLNRIKKNAKTWQNYKRVSTKACHDIQHSRQRHQKCRVRTAQHLGGLVNIGLTRQLVKLTLASLTSANGTLREESLRHEAAPLSTFPEKKRQSR